MNVVKTACAARTCILNRVAPVRLQRVPHHRNSPSFATISSCLGGTFFSSGLNSLKSESAFRSKTEILFGQTRLFATMGQGGSHESRNNLGRLRPEETALFVCDVQERFRSVIHGFPAVVDVAQRMVRAAPELGLAGIVVTEQYPKALGSTVAEVGDVLGDGVYKRIVAKTDFSMVVPEVKEVLEKNGPLSGVKSVLLLGVETHVCVLQTTIDLIEMGYDVHILVDGVSSQRVGDRAAALHRLAAMHPGRVHIASSEMAMFQMMVNTSHPGFKAVSTICKGERDYEPLPPM